MKTELLHKELTNDIIAAFNEVYNELGFGFLEKVYQNALAIEIVLQGFKLKYRNRLWFIFYF